jgi:hypothetical protein
MSYRFAFPGLIFLSLVALISIAANAAPLKEQGLAALVAAGFEDDEIVAKIAKDGIDFTADAATIERLKQSGISEPVLKAIQAAKGPAAATSVAPLITFESIMSLLENGVESDLIIARLRKSAATYTLSLEQEDKLRAVGASLALIDAMKKGVKDADTPEPISDLALVLDVSASMNEQTADGRTKIDVAKEVVGDLVRKIPAGLNVSVVIYGHAPGCSAVKVLRNLAELKATEREPLIAELQSLTAVGNTPIALALRQAGQQFAGRQTYCGVILITDGLESCNGDPAAEAAKLAENPMLRFGVNVLGFGLKPAESAATAEIAKQGKGKYYDTQDREQLLSAIQEVTEKLDKGAELAPLNPVTPTGKRAVVVTNPSVTMPAIKEIVTAKPDASAGTLYASRINSVNQYDAELRQPSADPVDLWLVPEKGLAVQMVTRLENPERRVVKLRPEDYLGLVRVSSEDSTAKVKIAVTKPDASAGTIYAYVVQQADGFNQDMIVPVGTYMLWVTEEGQEPTLLEAEIQVAGGQVSAFEY